MINELLNDFCKWYKIEPEKLMSDDRHAILVDARVVFSLICNSIGFKHATIAAMVSKERTSIVHYIKTARPAQHKMVDIYLKQSNLNAAVWRINNKTYMVIDEVIFSTTKDADKVLQILKKYNILS